jgi:subtilisin family serine protease
MGITTSDNLASAREPAGTAPYEEGTILVGYYPDVPDGRKGEIERDENATRHKVVGAKTHVLKVAKGQEASKLASLKQRPEVRYAEPNYIVKTTDKPSDAYYPLLWAMNNTGQVVNGVAGTAGADVKAEAAWAVTKGSKSIVVGIVDTGIDYTHTDLAGNIWDNPGGIGGCGAGTHGWNAITNVCDPMDNNNHGTHVAGTIGAVANNGGVAGVNWDTSLMGLKFLSANGSGTISDAIEAIHFAVSAKQAGVNIRVLNNSWGGGGYTQALLDEINAAGAAGILFVAAAGNSGINVDASPFYPCAYQAANLVCVAATDQNDARASFSNYGATKVHLGAPGTNILSTVRGGYAYYNGTSMATPHVTGAAALVLSKSDMNMSVSDLKSRILTGVDALPALAGKTVTGGRLNLCKAVPGCGATGPTVPAAPTLSATAGNAKVSLSWTTPADGGSAIKGYKVYRGSTSTSKSLLKTLSVVNNYEDNSVSNGSTYYYQVTAFNEIGEGARSNEVSAKPVAPAVPSAPSNLKASNRTSGQINLSWRAPSSIGSSPITGYRIYRGTTAGGETSLVTIGNTLSYRDMGVTRGTRYYYKVTAINAAGESGFSNEVNAVVR